MISHHMPFANRKDQAPLYTSNLLGVNSTSSNTSYFCLRFTNVEPGHNSSFPLECDDAPNYLLQLLSNPLYTTCAWFTRTWAFFVEQEQVYFTYTHTHTYPKNIKICFIMVERRAYRFIQKLNFLHTWPKYIRIFIITIREEEKLEGENMKFESWGMKWFFARRYTGVYQSGTEVHV